MEFSCSFGGVLSRLLLCGVLGLDQTGGVVDGEGAVCTTAPTWHPCMNE